ncbi:type II secretion system protein GspK [Pigmentibacter sp. JX0631]|uniref:general secretion pathway protein GspK n=1 Tax=Pigmentibacter sp. JX0631 TaxID=2976982 RepID=UPI00246861BD|nr:type II secretion system protein GspK [Pigmentibacter sp. JX0631]WGL59287.1 type II secretion system protein GspK [Pigmentibacter sp. JX0631]
MAIKAKLNSEKIRKKYNQGFALIFVLVFVAMIMGVIGDIVYQTQVGARGAIEERNGLDAQTSALSGIEFAKIMLNMNQLAAKYEGNPLIPIPKNMYSLINGQPIGSSGLAQLEELSGGNFTKAISPKIQEALKAIPGYFVLNITSENSKLNLNLLQANLSADAQKAFLRIFAYPDAAKVLEMYGYTPQQMVDNLAAYIKKSNTNGYQQTGALAAYSELGLKYKPKNGALESLEELRRIPGFHIDDIYNMFSPYFTIWPISGKKGTLNINSAPIELIAALLTPPGQDLNEQDWDRFELKKEKEKFKDNPKDWLSKNISGYKDIPDTDKITDLLFGNADNIFRIESRGVVNGVEKTLVVVVQMDDSKSSGNKNPNNDKDSDKKQTDDKKPENNNSQNSDKSNDKSQTNDKNKPNDKSQKKDGSFQILYSMWK